MVIHCGFILFIPFKCQIYSNQYLIKTNINIKIYENKQVRTYLLKEKNDFILRVWHFSMEVGEDIIEETQVSGITEKEVDD